jgi:predicted neutral ceramidase superfamily lipid hydrolase
MLSIGIVLGWAAVFAIGRAEALGLAHGTAQRLPIVGFALGMAAGLALALSARARGAAAYVGGPLLLGAVLWFFAVLLGGVLVAMGLAPDTADLIPAIAFVVGVVTGLVGPLVMGAERLMTLRSRRRGNAPP